MSTPKIVLASLAGLVLVAALGVVGWQFGWWLEGANVNRRVGIENKNLGTQTAWRDEALDLMNQASLLDEQAPQRAALNRQACDLIGRLTGNYRTDERIELFWDRECV